MNFNSLFQLSTLHRNHCSALEAADKILFMPDALSYMLTGKMVTEYTIASTSQMLNPRTKRFEKELLDVADIKEEQFGRFRFPGRAYRSTDRRSAENHRSGSYSSHCRCRS